MGHFIIIIIIIILNPLQSASTVGIQLYTTATFRTSAITLKCFEDKKLVALFNIPSNFKRLMAH